MHPLFRDFYEFYLIFNDFISPFIIYQSYLYSRRYFPFGAGFTNTFPRVVPGVEIRAVYEIMHRSRVYAC